MSHDDLENVEDTVGLEEGSRDCVSMLGCEGKCAIFGHFPIYFTLSVCIL